ncbi:MAG TPA: YceI family protein [Solirubrobacteraceae bacterium]|nr:YceI family protein [Solirubrobacteraceae bacterium]
MSTTVHPPKTLPSGTWTVDPVHSHVAFSVGYHVGTFRGSFAPLQATLEVSDDGQASLTGSVAASAVKVQDENLAAHLQSPDFFDAERTPEIAFASTAIRPAGEGEVEIEGQLTIKGTTLPILARGRIGEEKSYMDRPYFGLELEATLDRTRYGLNWNNPLPNGDPALADDVTVTAELFLTKSA